MLALISMMASVGGIMVDSRVLRREDMDVFIKEEEVEEEEVDATGWGRSQ